MSGALDDFWTKKDAPPPVPKDAGFDGTKKSNRRPERGNMSEEKLLTKLSDLQNIFRERDERSGRIVKQTSTLPRGVVLPAGWESARSPSGRTYFFHRSSGKSQWNPPLSNGSRTPGSRLTSRPPPPSRLGTIADAILERRQNRDTNTKSMVVLKKTSTSPSSTFPKPNVDIASSFFTSSPSSTRSVGKYSNTRRPVEEIKKIQRAPREPPKLAVIYRRQSLREQKDKSGVVVDDEPSKEDFSTFSNDALEKEYHRQLEVERRLLRKAAMLRKELQRPKNVFDGRNPFLSPRHGEESQEYIRSEASEARKRRVRINEVLRERRRGGINTENVAEQQNDISSKTQTSNSAQDIATPVMKNKVQTKPELPQGWSMTIDPSTGRPYYYHAETGESTWNPPGADDDGKEDKALPAGWARSTTRDGRKYYYNGATGQVQWEFPISHIASAEADVQDDDDPTGSTRKVHFVPPKDILVEQRRRFKERRYSRAHGGSITEENATRPGVHRRNLRLFLKRELNMNIPQMDNQMKWRAVLTTAQAMADVCSEIHNVSNEIRDLKRDILQTQKSISQIGDTNSVPAFKKMQERLKARSANRLKNLSGGDDQDDGAGDSKGDDDVGDTTTSTKEGDDDGDGAAAVAAPEMVKKKSYEELMQNPPTLKHQESSEDRATVEAFKLLDMYNTGDVKHDALIDYVDSEGLLKDDSDRKFLDTLLEAVDLNGDQKIQFVEFGAVMKELRARQKLAKKPYQTPDVLEERNIALSHHDKLKAIDDLMRQVRVLHDEERVKPFVKQTKISSSQTITKVLGLMSNNEDEYLSNVKQKNAELSGKVEEMYNLLSKRGSGGGGGNGLLIGKGGLSGAAPPGL